jgi:hypothetical protein
MGIRPEDAAPNCKYRRAVMRHDVDWILDFADAVYVLPQSHYSTGVKAEIAVARSIPIPVKFLRRNGVHKTAK